MKNSDSPDEKEFRRFLMEVLAPRKGEVVLDLGCGEGNEIRDLCRGGKARKVFGLDNSEKALAQARKNLRGFLKAGKVEFIQWDASRPLPFSSKTFDLVFSSDFLECVSGKGGEKLRGEIHRVLKPGGRMVMAHTDWDTQVLNCTDKDLERKLVRAYCDTKQEWMRHSEGWMGRRLWGWVRGKGLFKDPISLSYVLTNTDYREPLAGYRNSLGLEVALGSGKLGISKEEWSRFLRDLRNLARKKAYFYSVNRYIVKAYK